MVGVVGFANVDLNLLRALDALLELRSVTAAAERMGLSQPTMSAALARLRRHFEDEMLTRVGREYRLTPLAAQLRTPVRVAVAAADRVFDAQLGFEPAMSTREFRVVLSDYGARLIARELTAVLAREAPRARLRLSMATDQAADQADRLLMNHDLLLMPHGFVTGLPHRELYRDEWVCVVSSDNTEVGERLEVSQLESMPWAASYQGPTSTTQAARSMRLLGIEPQVRVVVTSFMLVPEVVAGSDLIAFLPRRLAERLPAASGVRALACPVEVPPLNQSMWWHPVYDSDPEHAYLRNTVHRVTAPLRVTSPGGVIESVYAASAAPRADHGRDAATVSEDTSTASL